MLNRLRLLIVLLALLLVVASPLSLRACPS
jgi:hypothetical protein